MVYLRHRIGGLRILAVAGPLIPDGLDVDSLTLGTPDTITFLFSFSSTPTEISMIVGPAVLGIGAVIGLVYAFVRSYQRAKPSARGSSAEV